MSDHRECVTFNPTIMSVQINDISDFHIEKGAAGRWLAWPYEDESIIANGDTEQEAINNLIAMCQQIADYEGSKELVEKAISRHFDMTGIDGLADCIWQAFEKRPKEELTTGWYCSQLIRYFGGLNHLTIRRDINRFAFYVLV